MSRFTTLKLFNFGNSDGTAEEHPPAHQAAPATGPTDQTPSATPRDQAPATAGSAPDARSGTTARGAPLRPPQP